MEGVEQIAKHVHRVRLEGDVGAQMYQVASPCRGRTLNGEIVREMLHTLRDVRLDVMLLLSVLRAPVDVSPLAMRMPRRGALRSMLAAAS